MWNPFDGMWGNIQQGAGALKDKIDQGAGWLWGQLGGPAKPDLGTGGIPGYEQYLQQLDQMMRKGNPYMQGAQLGQSQYDRDLRGNITQLQNMAAGRGPSLAEGQYRQASDTALQQQMAMAQSGRGNAARSARNAAVGQAQIGQGLASGVAQARTNEQMGAIGQLTGALGQAGSLEMQRQGLQAQLNQQANMQNQQAFMQMLAAKLGLSEAQAQNLLGYAGLQAGMYGADKGAPTAFDKLLNIFGTVTGMGGLGG